VGEDLGSMLVMGFGGYDLMKFKNFWYILDLEGFIESIQTCYFDVCDGLMGGTPNIYSH
jgi:hypothetical protein